MTATTGDFVAPGSCSDEDEDEETTGPPSFARQLGYEEGDDVLVCALHPRPHPHAHALAHSLDH